MTGAATPIGPLGAVAPRDGGLDFDAIFVDGNGSVVLSGFNAAASSIELWEGNGKGLLGTSADQVLINDLAVNPVSKNVYLAVSRGRGIEPTDVGGSEPVAVVSQTMADHFWPAADPVGKWTASWNSSGRSAMPCPGWVLLV